nr:hypothetical protein [Burkholderiales bacterium]
MSLINQMLRDLEDRQGAGEGRSLVSEVRPLPASKPSMMPRAAVASALVLLVAGSLFWWSRTMHRSTEKLAPAAPTMAISPPTIAPPPPAAVQTRKAGISVSEPQLPAAQLLAPGPRAASVAATAGEDAQALRTTQATSSPSRAAPVASVASRPDLSSADPQPPLKTSSALSTLPSIDRVAAPSVVEKVAAAPAAA